MPRSTTSTPTDMRPAAPPGRTSGRWSASRGPAPRRAERRPRPPPRRAHPGAERGGVAGHQLRGQVGADVAPHPGDADHERVGHVTWSAAQRPRGRAVTSRNAPAKAATTSGSKCVPAQRRSSSNASAGERDGAVGAVGRHRVEGVHHRHDAGLARDRVARQGIGKAGAVHPLVVRPDDPERDGRLVEEGGENLLAQDGVLLDVLELLGASAGPGLFRTASRVPILPMSCSSAPSRMCSSSSPT